MRFNEGTRRSEQISSLAAEHGLTERQVRHVLDGDVSGASGSGGHFGGSPNIRIVSESVNPVTGVRQAQIEVYNPRAGRFRPKSETSSLFPADWSEQQVVAEIESAFRNSKPVVGEPTQWKGVGENGLSVTGYYDDAQTSWSTGWPG